MAKWVWLGLFALFLYAAYGMADFDAVSGTSLPAYSSRRHDPFGSSALRELLIAHGRGVESLERPVPDRDGATLILIAPFTDFRIDARRAERLLAWVGGGNQLIILSRSVPPGLQPLRRKLDLAEVDRDGAVEALERAGEYREALAYYDEPYVYRAYLEDGSDAELLLAGPGIFSFDQDDDVTIIAEFLHGVAALSLPWGEGKIAVVGSPSPALNAGIVQADNADVLLSLVEHDAVYFDEYSLGLGREHSFMELLRRAGLVPLLAQAALALFLLARSADSDFGRTERGEAANASAEEEIRVLADLYRRTLSDAELTRHLGDHDEHQHFRRRQD